MSEKGKEILENLMKSVKTASDSQQEYLLGLTEGMALMLDSKKRTKRKPKPSK